MRVNAPTRPVGIQPRKTVKFCGRCGGKHAGFCNLVATSHGTHCRADIVDAVERRHRERTLSS